MRIAIARFSVVVATLLLLAVAPATRPSTGRFQLKVLRHAGPVTFSSLEMEVEADVPFSTTARIDSKIVSVRGTLTLHEKTQRLALKYAEAYCDGVNLSREQRVSDTVVEFEGSNTACDLSGVDDQKVTVSLVAAPER